MPFRLTIDGRRDLVDRIIDVLNRDFNDAGSYRQNKQTADEILGLVETTVDRLPPEDDRG